MEKCSHCGAVLGGATELVSGSQFIYVVGEMKEIEKSVYSEEVIISLENLRTAEYYCTGSREQATLMLTYDLDDNKTYFRGVMADKLFHELKRRCGGYSNREDNTIDGI